MEKNPENGNEVFSMNKISWLKVLAVCCYLAIQIMPADAGHATNARENGLNGPVETVIEEQMLPQAAEPSWLRVPLRTTKYNESGHAVWQRIYKGPGIFEDKGFRYDSEGRLVSSGYYTREGVFVVQVANQYDAAGNLAESRYLRQDGAIFLIKSYQYQAGKLIKETHASQTGAIIAVKEYTYDSTGRFSGIITYGQDGQMLASESSRKDGNESEHRYSGILQDYGNRSKSKQENDGRTGEICYLPDGSVYRNQVCEIREGGQIKRTVHREDGSLAVESVYNEAGDLVAVNRYSPDGTIEMQEQYRYRYDDRENWTERVVLRRGAAMAEWTTGEKTVRLINYYTK